MYMTNVKIVEDNLKELIAIGNDLNIPLSDDSFDFVLNKKVESLTTYQTLKLHPEVQRLLQFDTIQNLYYPEAFAPVEATTVAYDGIALLVNPKLSASIVRKSPGSRSSKTVSPVIVSPL